MSISVVILSIVINKLRFSRFAIVYFNQKRCPHTKKILALILAHLCWNRNVFEIIMNHVAMSCLIKHGEFIEENSYPHCAI